MSSPKPAAAQYASMCAKLRAERSRLVDGGVPGCAIVYVVRNDPEDEITKTGPQLGAWFTTIDDAIQTFAIVFMVADEILSEHDLYDVHAVDLRTAEGVQRVCDLLVEPEREQLQTTSDEVNARLLAYSLGQLLSIE
jgi:hypothetical protein